MYLAGLQEDVDGLWSWPIGVVTPWLGGTLTRTASNLAVFVNPYGGYSEIVQGMSLEAMASLDPAIAAHFASYGWSPAPAPAPAPVPAGQWTTGGAAPAPAPAPMPMYAEAPAPAPMSPQVPVDSMVSIPVAYTGGDMRDNSTANRADIDYATGDPTGYAPSSMIDVIESRGDVAVESNNDNLLMLAALGFGGWLFFGNKRRK